MTEDHCVPEHDWCAELRRVHRTYPEQVIGGAIENGAKGSRVDWACYFCEYGDFMLPLRHAPAGAVPGTNASYKRELVDAHRCLFLEGWWDYFLHQELARRGATFRVEPRLRVLNAKSFTREQFDAQSFDFARDFRPNADAECIGISRVEMAAAFAPASLFENSPPCAKDARGQAPSSSRISRLLRLGLLVSMCLGRGRNDRLLDTAAAGRSPATGRDGTRSMNMDDSILRCPRCREELAWETDRAICTRNHAFPIRFGIPDFRIAPDPYIGIDEEVAKIERMLGPGGRSFEELIARYYELTPEVPSNLQAQYRQGLLAGEKRGRHLLEWMEARMERPQGPVLDLGCGTAGLALAAQGRGLASVRHRRRFALARHRPPAVDRSRNQAAPFLRQCRGSSFCKRVVRLRGLRFNAGTCDRRRERHQ